MACKAGVSWVVVDNRDPAYPLSEHFSSEKSARNAVAQLLAEGIGLDDIVIRRGGKRVKFKIVGVILRRARKQKRGAAARAKNDGLNYAPDCDEDCFVDW